jgi:hypothetical protein
MKLEVLRFSSQNDSTLSMLFDVTDNCRKFLCFSLEDEYREVKVMGETRIPKGVYNLGLRKEGGFYTRYNEKFGAMNIGMIQVQDVPGFEYILWHIGNTDEDTAGCLLLGDTSQQNITKGGFIGSSTDAYKRVYPPIAAAIESGEEVKVEYIDFA